MVLNLDENKTFLDRDEKKKVDAVKDFYEKYTIEDDTVVKILTFFGKIGIPIIFFVFITGYWVTGMSKFISG